MNPTATRNMLLGPDEGEVIEARGNRLVVKAASPRQLVCDYVAPAHFPGPPLHVHHGFDETFLVMAGRLRVQVGEEVVELGVGATAYVDGNLPHTFANPGSRPVRFLLVCSPGGFEDYFRAVAAGDEAAITEVSERLGYAPVG